MHHKISIIFIVLLIEFNSASLIKDILVDATNSLADPSPDGRLNFTELAMKCGLTVEEYKIVTEDNYIVTVFHIPGDKEKCILLMHGFLDSADTFILRKEYSLLYQLSKAGYDVWVGNHRGSQYSRYHKILNPNKDKQYWNFSFHEIGYYDMPATIDFILKTSGQTQLRVIGHSEGNTIFLVLGATRPEYNAKIKVCIALAPICHLQHLKPPIKDVAEIGPVLNAAFNLLGYKEVFSNRSEAKALLNVVCTTQLTSYAVCAQIGYRVLGFEPDELEPEFYSLLILHYPAGSSWKNTYHLMQLYSNNKFRQYVYDSESENKAVYGVPSPPEYNLSNVSMKMVFYCAKGDKLSVIVDVDRLRGELPNVKLTRVMARDTFNHVDYVWGKTSYKDVYQLIIEDLETYNY